MRIRVFKRSAIELRSTMAPVELDFHISPS